MTIRELVNVCKENSIDCDSCEYENYCYHILPKILEDISPYGLLTILDKEVKERD